MTYLGTESNPATGMVYDYWLHRVPDSKSLFDVSYTCRHGDEPSHYGSGPICTAEQTSARDWLRMSVSYPEDYIFGIYRAQHFALYYLATGLTPLIGDGG